MTCGNCAAKAWSPDSGGPAATMSAPLAARTIAALLALRDQGIAPILAGIRSPQREGHNPASWTAVDRDYENLRIGMKALFKDLGIHAALPAE